VFDALFPGDDGVVSTARPRSLPVGQIVDGGYTLILTLLVWLIFVQNAPHSLAGYQSGVAGVNFGAANLSDRTIKLTMLAVGGFLCLLRPVLAREILRTNPGLCAVLATCIASISWSIAPAQTVLRLVSLAAFFLTCLGFSLASWHPRRFQQVLLPPLMIILVGSLIVGLIDRNLVIEASDQYELKNSWHGLTHGKNELGMISGMSFIICMQLALGGSRSRPLSLLAAAASMACLVLSRSNTSMFASLLAVFSMTFLMFSKNLTRKLARRLVSAAGTIIVVYELAIQNLIPGLSFILSPITFLTGKDTTFSSRTTIWAVVKEHIRQRPLFGTGYGAYWIGPLPESPSYIFLSVMWLYPTESHNGYLEIINDLGFFGLCCLIAFIWYYLRNALRLMQIDRAQGAMFIALLIFELVVNLSESDWFSRSNTFAMVLLATTCMARAMIDARVSSLQAARARGTATSRAPAPDPHGPAAGLPLHPKEP
jgi:exopolysaccharide production protein ExoQ